MATPIKLNIATKEDFAPRPSVPANKKESASEFNQITNAIKVNYDRLTLMWSTDIAANVDLAVGQYVHFTDNLIYRITTGYNVGNPITWDGTKAAVVNGANRQWRGAYDLSLTNDYPVNGAGSADDGSLVSGDEFYVSEAGTLNVGGSVIDIYPNAILKYLTGDPTLPASWKVIQ